MAELEWVELTTVGDLLVRAAALWPDNEAVLIADDRRTYARLLDEAERAARSLLGLGVRPGNRVGILMPNCHDFVSVELGCALLGVSFVPINARYKSHELTHLLGDAELAAVVTTDLAGDYVDFPALIEESLTDRPEGLAHLILLGASSRPGFVDRADFGAAAELVPSEDVHHARQRVPIRSEAMMMYTSGTTSQPKGCVISHEALVRVGIEQAIRWQLKPTERFWNPLPMFHMGGISPLLAHMVVGGLTITQTHFDVAAVLELMERERCTFAYPTFPTITQSLINHPSFDTTDLSSVTLVNDTGQEDSLRLVQSKFPQAAVVTLFGMTETCGGVSWSGPDDPLDQRMTTGGFPFRGTQVRIVDPESGEELPAGERGEITVRGPGLFTRYHNDPKKTAEAMRGGWFHTGDLGRVDAEGRLTFLGRIKDMLKVGGENVAAVEIEAYLTTHPAVKIAQVVPVPDEKYLEVPGALVELVDGAEASEEDLIAYCKGTIAGFKVPRYVRFVDGWPMSGTKIKKFQLREDLLRELGIDAPA
jgi:acyl-CoA synthetase (AMP-forming)/AMP-acid ligase II